MSSPTSTISSCLLEAVSSGQTESVRELLSAGADVNIQHTGGVTPLHVASQKGYVDIVKLLLCNHAQIEVRNITGCTPLWQAAARGHTEVIDLLIQHKADVEAISYSRHLPLQAAINNGHTDAALMLLDRNPHADRNSIYHNSLYIFLTKVFRGREKLFLSLEKQLRTYGIQGSMADLKYEFMNNFVRNLLWFISGRSWSPKDATIPGILCWLWGLSTWLFDSKCVHVGRKLYHAAMSSFASNNLDQEIKVSYTNWNLTDSSTVEADNDYGSEIDIVTVVSAFCEVVYNNYIYDDNLTLFAPIDSRCNIAAFIAAIVCAENMKSVLKNGADIEIENVDGRRLIHYAVRTERVEIVQPLIQHGANLDVAEMYSIRPLHEAICHGLDVVKLLVESGAKLNVQNIDGKTPLHIAVERQKLDVIMYLLSQNIDVGLTDAWRNTALHYLTTEMSKQLIAKGFEEDLAKFLNNAHLRVHQQLSVRNAVGISAFTHVATHVTPLVCLPVTLRTMEPTYIDCQGNTPLHHAVGVYGKMKMFTLGSEVGKVVDFLMEHGADMNVRNKEGLTPLHVARGQHAIKACLRYADSQSFTIPDEQGRNFWHLLFLLRTEDEVEMALGLLRATNESNGKFAVDDLHRTPLHYACMRTGGWKEGNEFTNNFVKKFSDEHANEEDTFGRTAAHYAAIFGNQKSLHLLEMNSEDGIEDNFKLTPRNYLSMRQELSTKLSLLRLKESSSIMAMYSRRIPVCVGECFAQSSNDVAQCTEELGSIIRELNECNDTSVKKIYRECRINYTDEQHELPKLLASPTRSFCEEKAPSENPKSTVFEAIHCNMNEAMEVLASKISALDSRFICKVVPVGSGNEGTRIGCCDEFDYNFVLTHLSRSCKVWYSPESPAGFVQLKASTSEYDEVLFDSNGTLNTRIVKFQFEALVKRVLSSTQFCSATGLEFIDQFKAGGLPGGIVTAKLHTCIKLAFTRPVNGHHVLHSISVDVVPALQINDWWPEDARRPDLCQSGDCLIVFTQPQDRYPWIGWTEPHGFISFAQAESRRLRERPQVVKAAYMVVKRMSKYFCQYDFFPSHVIKTALLWCLDENNVNITSDGDTEEKLLHLVRNILQRLLCFAAQDFVPCYFMPKCHQPVWVHEKHLKQFHIRMHRHGLTYADLFNLKEQHSQDKLLQHIKETCIFSHVMYWSMLSDTEKLEFFIPPNINPFCEVTYN